MGSYDFVTADKLRKNGWPFFGPMSYNLAFLALSRLDLAPWQKVDLATLHLVVPGCLRVAQ